MLAARPTAGTTFPIIQFRYNPVNVIRPGFLFLDRDCPTDPLVPGKWREAVPSLERIGIRGESISEILRHFVDHAGLNVSLLAFHLLLPTDGPSFVRSCHHRVNCSVVLHTKAILEYQIYASHRVD